MAWTSRVFVGTDHADDLISTLEKSFDGTFTQADAAAPYLLALRDAHVSIYLDRHPFANDDIALADGTLIPLRSEYPYNVDVRDVDNDLANQRKVAQRVFDTLKQTARWKLVYVENEQLVLETYEA